MGKMVSIVIPVFNEAGNLCELYQRLINTLQSIPFSFEIIFVEDGGHDNSWPIIQDLHKTDARVKGIKLSRNFGHQIAITSGLDHARGDVAITMDGDLQHPPELIPDMIKKWQQGYDVVYTIREDTQSIGRFKKASSAVFYRLINNISDIHIDKSAADFRLLDRKVLYHLNAMRERARFLRGLVSWVGFSQAELHYVAKPRFAGETKYSLSKMVHLAFTAIFSFTTLPLKISFYIGVLVNILCVPLVVWALYTKFYTDTTMSGWASTFIIMLFMSGVQLIMLGIIGAYLGRVFEEVKNRPLYITRRTIGLDPAAPDGILSQETQTQDKGLPAPTNARRET
jgi:dolichol-phosphate mannosyltransferase